MCVWNKGERSRTRTYDIIGRTIARACNFYSYTYIILVLASASILNTSYLTAVVSVVILNEKLFSQFVHDLDVCENVILYSSEWDDVASSSIWFGSHKVLSFVDASFSSLSSSALFSFLWLSICLSNLKKKLKNIYVKMHYQY